MLELVDGIVATGESAFRPGRLSDHDLIDPVLLADGVSEEQQESSQGAVSEHGETSEKVQTSYHSCFASILMCTYHRMIRTTQSL